MSFIELQTGRLKEDLRIERTWSTKEAEEAEAARIKALKAQAMPFVVVNVSAGVG